MLRTKRVAAALLGAGLIVGGEAPAGGAGAATAGTPQTITASVHAPPTQSHATAFSVAANSDSGLPVSVVESVTAQNANQTITFGPLEDATFGDLDYDIVDAFASSDLAVSLTAGGKCILSGVTVHLLGAGSCTATATQALDANYNAALPVPRPSPSPRATRRSRSLLSRPGPTAIPTSP
jgi:hypothetical protein